MIIKCKILHKDARIPHKHSKVDSSLDLYCCESISIPSREIKRVRTGLALDIPDNHVGIIWARSSTIMKGIQCLAGLWDPRYIGEVAVNMFNFSTEDVTIKKYERFAKFIVVELNKDLHIQEVIRLPNRNRKK